MIFIYMFSFELYARGHDDTVRLEYKYQVEAHFVNLFRKVNTEHKSQVESIYYKKSAWKYHAFIMRIRPRLGFNIPGMVTLSMVPETEFYWSRK